MSGTPRSHSTNSELVAAASDSARICSPSSQAEVRGVWSRLSGRGQRRGISETTRGVIPRPWKYDSSNRQRVDFPVANAPVTRTLGHSENKPAVDNRISHGRRPDRWDPGHAAAANFTRDLCACLGDAIARGTCRSPRGWKVATAHQRPLDAGLMWSLLRLLLLLAMPRLQGRESLPTRLRQDCEFSSSLRLRRPA